MIIFALIRILYFYLAIMLLVTLFESKSVYQKIAYAVISIPFIMRALLLK